MTELALLTTLTQALIAMAVGAGLLVLNREESAPQPVRIRAEQRRR